MIICLDFIQVIDEILSWNWFEKGLSDESMYLKNFTFSVFPKTNINA